MREAAYAQGLEEFDSLASDATFRDFICLYVAEGYKRIRNIVFICNFDPAVMQLSVRWLRHLSTKPLTFRIQYHADQDLEDLCAFLGRTLDVAPGIDQAPTQVEQRPTERPNLAFGPWRPCGQRQRHAAAFAHAGVDRAGGGGRIRGLTGRGAAW